MTHIPPKENQDAQVSDPHFVHEDVKAPPNPHMTTTVATKLLLLVVYKVMKTKKPFKMPL